MKNYITRGTTQDVGIQSTPSTANVQLSTGQTCVTPCMLKMKRNNAFTGTVTKNKFKPGEFIVNTAISSGGTIGLAGNLIAGGVIGVAVDAGSGAMYDLYPNNVHVQLQKR